MGAGSTPKPQDSGGPEGAYNNPGVSNNPWAGVSGGRLAEAQKFADQGQWNQAAQQYQLGGGQFGQPQMQAFTQQYGNSNPFSQLSRTLGGPSYARPSEEKYGAQQTHNTLDSSDMGPQTNYQPYPAFPGGGYDKPPPGGSLYTSDDYWGPPQAQPSLPPAQPMPPMNIPGQQPMPTPPQMAAPTPPSPGFMGHQNVSAGRLAEAQRLGKIAGIGGNMGLAKQQWELGGGKWSPDAHMFLDGRLAGGGGGLLS